MGEICLVSSISFVYYIFKNGCENEFEHNNEDYAAALEKRSLTKSILQPLGLTSPIRQRGSYGQI